MNEKPKILIVDDREENLIALQRLLAELEIETVSALSGNEALQQLIEHEFALVLMDVQMPEMDGFETVEIMRQNKDLETTPVIFISAIYKEEHYTIKGMESGAVDFIVKPIIPEVLLGKVRIFTNLYQQHKELELANSSLIESEDKYRTLFNRDTDAIFLFEPESYKIIEANDATSRMYGYTKEELIGMPCIELSDEKEESTKAAENVKKKGKINIPYRTHKKKDGTKFYVDISGYKIFLMEKEVMFATSKDITARVEAEQNLIEAQKIAKLGSFKLNFKTEIMHWSDQLFNIYKLPVSEDSTITLKDALSHIHPEDLNYSMEALKKASEGKGTEILEYRIICSDRETRWVQGQSEMIYNEQGNLIEMYGTVQDITPIKEVEIELEWNLLVNSTIAELSRSFIASDLSIKEISKKVFDASKKLTESEHGYVSEIDRVTKDNVGHTLSEMMGNDCKIQGPNQRITFPCGENGIYPKMWGRVLNTKKTFIANNFTEHPMFSGLPKGHVPIKNFLSIPVLYNNEVVGQIALANKPTDYKKKHQDAIIRIAELYAMAIHKKREEEDKKKLQDELQQSEKMQLIGQLAGGIAHDFNNQLATIMGNAELSLAENIENNFVKKSLSNIITVSKRAADLTSKLLAYARKGNYLSEDININNIIKEVISILERTIDKKIKLVSNLEHNNLIIKGDPTQIYSAILNIALNARDALEGTGTITFTSKKIEIDDTSNFKNQENLKHGQFIELAISDTGTGIPNNVLEKIFDPFFTTKELGKGTGMGLSAVLGIVKMHDGAIDITTKPNKGSTFKLLFPLKNKIKEDKKESTHIFPKGKYSGTVLLIDDEEMICDFLEAVFRKMGFEVLTAYNGKKALDIFRERYEDIDLTILDIIMPIMDGKETLKKMLKIDPNAKIVASTGYTGDYTPQELMDFGALDIIKKPFDINVVIESINKLISE